MFQLLFFTVVSFMWTFFINRIEGIAQNAAITFYEDKEWKDFKELLNDFNKNG